MTMLKALLVAATLLCAVAPAHANASSGHDDQRGGHRSIPYGSIPYGAPEPVTLLGLGLGAAAIGVVAWRATRRK